MRKCLVFLKRFFFKSDSSASFLGIQATPFVEIMLNGGVNFSSLNSTHNPELNKDTHDSMSDSDSLVGIDEVQKSLNRSRASVYRYTNTDARNLNPPFNHKKLNPEYRSDQKDPLLFHPNEVARFAKDVLRIKEVTVEVLNSPSSATQQVLLSILEELRSINTRLDEINNFPTSDFDSHRDRRDIPAA